MNKILIIDDDVDICHLLQRYLNKQGFDTRVAFTGSKGLAALKEDFADVVLSDFRLPDYDGIALIKAIKSQRRETQVIVITGYSDVKLAIQSVRSGAFEYVTKPIQPEEILSTIKEAIAAADHTDTEAEAPSQNNKKSAKNKQTTEQYVTGSSQIAKTLDANIALIAPTNMSVIVLGETGTGKEVAARMIHQKSARTKKPFLAIDCGALPKELASSELFGHVKGAFTGALRDKTGSFEQANGGTLFLDEIGNLTYDNQIKLLRVLQERQIRRIGGDKDIDIDVRIIVATNENLQEAVNKNEFREDLYYRLNEFKIELTPLRSRKTDLMDFAMHFLDMANNQLDRNVEEFSPEVVDKLKAYHWHGNLRELKNVVKRATLLTQGTRIEMAALPDEIINPTYFEEEGPEGDDGPITSLKDVAEKAEKRAIENVLRKTNYNKTKTAQILDVDRKTLYNKILAYGIET